MKIIILTAKSAGGKDFIYQKLVEKGCVPIISATSRPMREGEVEGKSYFFKTKEQFLSMIENNEFLEYRSYNSASGEWFYGTPNYQFQEESDNVYVTVLELQGAKAFLDKYGPEICHIYYLDVPDNIREQRAIARKSFDKTEWDRRLQTDTADFSECNLNAINPVKICNYDCDPEDVVYEIFARTIL